jgi:DnaJ family protein B protein 4
MESTNYYDVLGVSHTADEVAIKRAFRRLSLELHPDKSKTESSRYSSVMKAYKVLSDIQQRKLYDMTLRPQHNVKHGGNVDTRSREDYNVAVVEIEQSGRRKEPGVRQEVFESDLETIRKMVNVSLADCYQGTTIPVKINRNVDGNVEEALVYVDIPRGTDDGEVLECVGQGHVKGRSRADVRIRIAVEPHPCFKREGMNLVYRIELSLKEAMCGFTREIEHLDGKKYKVTSEVGKVVQPGSMRTIPGKGFIRNGCMRTGNLEIVFDVKLPETLSVSELKQLQTLLE